MTTTPTGVEQEPTSDEAATNAFLSNWTDAGLLSESDEGAPDNAKGGETLPDDDLENTSEGQNEDDDLDFGDEDNDDNEAEEADDQNTVEAPDDAVVKITVDGEEKAVPVKDLKRLFGQEASLTRKSQEVAEARKAAEENGAKFVAATGKLLEKAQARFEPYAQIDWMLAQKTLTNKEFAALRKEAITAYEDVQFLTSEVETVMAETQQIRQAEMVEAAKESLKVLQERVPDWSREHYTEIRDYALNAGLTEEAFNSILDPNAILIIRDAMMYRKAKERAEAKRKSAPSPRRVMRASKGAGSVPAGRKVAADQALTKLRNSGSDEDAANLFLSRWSADA